MDSVRGRPLIGIPSGSCESSDPGVKTYRFNGNYTAALAMAEGLPIAIPLNLPEEALRAIFERLDGLLLAGGSDVDPAHYSEAAHPALGPVDASRDETELRLARWALAADLPMLAICRGIQVLNVAAGGNLYQDIPAQIPAALRHHYDLAESPWHRSTHQVRLTEGSRLKDIAGSAELSTNSFHHQAVKQVADGFSIVAYSTDGVIEGIETHNRRFAIGVQWHPEAMTRVDRTALRLFEAFVAAAQQR